MMSRELNTATVQQSAVPGSDESRQMSSSGDGRTDVLKLFLCNTLVDELKKRPGNPLSASVPARRKAHLKPILLKRNDKQRKKRPCSLDGGVSVRKKVHFDSKVAVRALPGALEYTRAMGGGPDTCIPPTTAAPLCELTELDSFQWEMDSLSEEDAVISEKNTPTDKAKLGADLATKLPSNQSKSDRNRSAPLQDSNGFTSDPSQPRSGRTATVLPAGGNKPNSERVPQSVDDATGISGASDPLPCPEPGQSATTAAASQSKGLILASVSRSTSRTLDPEKEGRAASTGAGDIQRLSVRDSVGEHYQDAVTELDISTTRLREDETHNGGDTSTTGCLSFDSRSLIRAAHQRVHDPEERAVVTQLSSSRLSSSAESGTVCNVRPAVPYISGSEPDKNGNDLHPDGRVNRDFRQRSLPRILQDGGDNNRGGSARPDGDKHLVSDSPSLVYPSGDILANNDGRSGSVSVIATSAAGLGCRERLETEIRSKSSNREDAANKPGEYDDVFHLELGQKAPCADKYNLAGETRRTGGIYPVAVSPRLGETTNSSKAQGVELIDSPDWKNGTSEYCSLDKLGSHNMDSEEQHEDRTESHLAEVAVADEEVVSSLEVRAPSSAEARLPERRLMEVTSDREAGNRDIDPEGTSASPRVDHTERSGSDEFPMNESSESKAENVPTVSEPAAYVESKLDMDIVISELGSSTNLERSAVDEGREISTTGQTPLAPLAREEEEEESDDTLTETSGEDGVPSGEEQRVGCGEKQPVDESDVGASGRRDSVAETDFTEDSERTFVMNTDADDDIVESDARQVSDGSQKETAAAEKSMAEKFKMISQSGILPGRSSLRSMLEQRAKFSSSSKQNLSQTEVNEDVGQASSGHPGDGLKERMTTEDDEAAKPTPVEPVTTEIAVCVPGDEATVSGTAPEGEPRRPQPSSPCFAVAEVPSGSMAAILDVAGADEEVDMSTLERKRKRAKSEEKTSSSHGVFADSAISQKDVEEAVKKLRKSSEDGLQSRPDSQSAPANRRRYDWNTYHFFPDIHDVDAETTIHKRRSRESIYSQYIEEEWLQSSDVNGKDSMMDLQQVGDEEECKNVSPDSKPGVQEESGESMGSSSCDGDDSPKVWRKNPLLVRRKKKSERRLSAEFHQNTVTDDGDLEMQDISSKPGYESPSFRSRRSPRRHSSPNRNRTQRKNSDLIQEKVEKFQELQRRRRALESNSEESLALPRKQGQKFRYQRSEGNGIIKVTDLMRRSHSQEDIHYESGTQTTLVHTDLACEPKNIKNTRGLLLLNRSQHKPGQGHAKSQYDFLSTEVQNVESIQQGNVYTPEHDKRKALKDYRNASSSFENIYDAVDLSMDVSSMDLDVRYHGKPDVAAASGLCHLNKQQPPNAAAQTGHQPIQVNIDARQLPAKVSVDSKNVPILASAASPPNSHLDNAGHQQHQHQPSRVKQSMTSTSPVWYVPKPQQQYDIPTITPEKKQKKLDAKALIEEEKKKFEDYKREYVRRLSERDSNSGASGDEQRHDAEPKHRVIPPDDYEYILRKIHHKRQDAYYAESTSQYPDQTNKSEAERLKYSILMKKQQQQQQCQQQQQQALQQHSAVPITTQASTAGKSPTKLYLDSLNLPSVHERSTSQLSTESSRELEQYFIPSKAKQTDPSQPVQQQWSDSSKKYKEQQEGKKQQPKERIHKASVVVNLDNSELAEPDIIREGSVQTLLTDMSQDNEHWLSYQNQIGSNEGNGLEKKPSAVAGYDVDRPGQYLPSKPPVPKQEDASSNAHSQWNYNTAYSPERAYSDQLSAGSSAPVPENRQTSQQIKPPQHDVPDEQQTRIKQPQSGQEKYGLVLRVTPQGAIASSPGADEEVSLPVKPVQSRDSGDRPRYARPLSSSFLEYNPERRVYESEQVQGSRDHQLDFRQGVYFRQSVPFRSRHSQDDFQQLKDDLQYKEKHATPFRGHSLGRDRPGPSKTPPPFVSRYDQQSSPPVGWDPRQMWSNYQLERHKVQPESLPSEPRQRHDSFGDSAWPSPTHGYQVDPLSLAQYQQDLPLGTDKEKPNISQKSWSMRINEVESMRPPSSRDQTGGQMELARSFAVVAISDKNKEKGTEQKVPFKSYEDKVRRYCQESRSSPRELPQPSLASSQYEEHVKRSQERYRAEKHASVETGSDQPVYPSGSQKTDYVDPTFIRQRKVSNENVHASSLQNLPLQARDPLHKGPGSSASDTDLRRSYGLQIQVEKPKPEAKSSEICLKLSHSKEDLNSDKPNISIDSIKDKLFGNSIDKGSEASFKEELEKLWERHDRKVSAIQTEVFSAKDSKMPQYQSYSTSSAQGYDDDNDQRLLYYVSYKDGQARKRSNIYDVLTDLEKTYEQLDLDDENLLTAAERREYVSNVMALAPSSTRPEQEQPQTLAPESTEPNVKRLSITNLKKLEYLQKEQDTNPSLEYAKRWLEEDKSRVITANQSDPGFIESSTTVPASAPSESEISCNKLASLPRKVKDDMAFRRQNPPTGSTSSHPDLPTVSYLAKSPSVSPSQSVESLSKRSCRSHTPDRTRDDLMLRNLQRAKSPGVSETDPSLLALRSPTSTDYLNERTTEPARGRMRLRPERQADKYHDDLAYRKLRKDVPPVVAELPDSYYRMKGVDNRLRMRSQSLERVCGERRSRETRRTSQPLERSQSLGPRQQPSTDRQPSLSKGISYMVDFFSQPVTRTQSAPDLTGQSVFGESYNEQGDLISDDPRYAKYAQKPKKQQTPRTVKLRHEMKSKMRQIKHSADSGYMEQSESDASHSSSGPETRSPPDGNFDIDDHELRLSDTSSDKEALKDASKKHISTTVFTSTAQSNDAFSHIKFIDDGDEQNGNNNNNNNNRLVTKQDIPLAAKELPHHTFVLSLPSDSKVTQFEQQRKQSSQDSKQDREWLDEREDGKQPKYLPQFYPPTQSPIKQTAMGTRQQLQHTTTPYQPSNKQQFVKDSYHSTPGIQTPQQGGQDHKQAVPNVSKLPSESFYQQRARFLKDIPAAASQFKAKRQQADVSSQKVDMKKQDWPGVAVREAETYPSQKMINQGTPQQAQQRPVYQQQVQQKMSYHPQTQQILHYQPQAQQNMGYQPQAQQNMVYEHQAQQNMGYQQQAQQNIGYQPQAQQNIGYQPQAQQNMGYQQQAQQNIGYKPKLQQKPSYQLQQKPVYQPQAQQKPTYQPQSQQKPGYQPQKQLDPYYPQQYQTLENARQLQQPLHSYGIPDHQDVPHYQTIQQDSGKPQKSEARGQTKLTKPAPPTRVSSLIHEPYVEELSQSPPQSLDTQQPAQRIPTADRRSWPAPTSLQKVEIVQPATIETRTSKDMERHIKEAERRSWHEQKEEPDDGKQVKLEFAFKAPEGTQFVHGLPGSKSLEQVQVISLGADHAKLASADHAKPASADRAKPASADHAKPASATTSLQFESSHRSGSQITQTYLPPSPSSRQQSDASPAKVSKDSKSNVTRAKVELPVIYSQPRSAAAAAAPQSQPPSYTVAPIIKKPQKPAETEDSSNTPANVTALAKKTETVDDGNTKAKNSQQIQLQDITQIIRDPAGKKPTSKLRTTQIQVVTSTLLPPEDDDEPRRSLTDETTKRTSEDLSVSSSSTSLGTPVVVVTAVDKSNHEDHSAKARILLQSSAKQDPSSPSNREGIMHKKRLGSLQDKGLSCGLSASSHPVKESYLSTPTSLLSPTSPLSPTERSAHSPIFSPPPRRAGTDHFELSDGEMTDATDITLDGLVRSNMYRPSSPETIDFSDFADNFSETASDIAPQEVKRMQFISRTRGETVLKQTNTHCQQKVVHTTSNISGNRTVSQRTESTRGEEIVSSAETCKVSEEDREPNLSFKDLVKSFEARTNPFKHITADSPHRSSSTDELPSKVKADTRKADKTTRVLKQISGSDPNLSKMSSKGPSWRRL